MKVKGILSLVITILVFAGSLWFGTACKEKPPEDADTINVEDPKIEDVEIALELMQCRYTENGSFHVWGDLPPGFTHADYLGYINAELKEGHQGTDATADYTRLTVDNDHSLPVRINYYDSGNPEERMEYFEWKPGIANKDQIKDTMVIQWGLCKDYVECYVCIVHYIREVDDDGDFVRNIPGLAVQNGDDTVAAMIAATYLMTDFATDLDLSWKMYCKCATAHEIGHIFKVGYDSNRVDHWHCDGDVDHQGQVECIMRSYMYKKSFSGPQTNFVGKCKTDLVQKVVDTKGD